jgi:hypothetical protein
VSSKKQVCVPNFLTKPAPHLFWGQTDRLVRSWAKLFRTKTSLHFSSQAPKIVFLKKHVSGQNFFPKPHHNNYGERTDYVALLGQKFSSTKFRSSKKHACVPKFFTKPPPHVFFDVNLVKNNETQQRKGTQDRSMDRFEWKTSTRCL